MDRVAPGKFLRALLNRRHESVRHFAERVGVKPHVIQNIIHRGSRISPDLMFRFELCTGIPARRWADMQNEVLLEKARRKQEGRQNDDV